MARKRWAIAVGMVVVAALVTVCSVGFFGVPSSHKYVVVVDAGHGYPDGGTTGIVTGVCEADLNLQISKKLKTLLESSDFRVVMTRSGKDALYSGDGNFKRGDMKMRKEIIERTKPDLVISVHLNRYSGSYRKGAQAFFRKDSESGMHLAQNMQKSLNRILNERELSALSGDYYMLSCTDFPSVIVECGFLSNPQEEAALMSDSYQEQVAYGIYAGIVSYLHTGADLV